MHTCRIHKPHVLVVYQYIALYRLPVFKELARSTEFTFTFMSGTKGKGATPKLATRSQLECSDFTWVHTGNCWLAGGLLWQGRVVATSFSRQFDAFIFLGDMHYLSTWAATLIVKMLRKPALFWTIGMHRPESGARLVIRNIWHRMPDHLLVYGNYAKQLMISAGQDQRHITVIGNSLDFTYQTSVYEALQRDVLPSRSRPLLVSVGRLTSRRKIGVLIEAVMLLRSRGMWLDVRVIGDGPERQRLEAMCCEKCVTDSFTFLGAVYDEACIARHLYEADLCVVPGVIGLGAIHAHTYGTPVITCGDPAVQAPEAEVIIPGKTGAFCEWDDPSSVANEIEVWLLSMGNREGVRVACRQSVRNGWTPIRQRQTIEGVLRRICRPFGHE